ncbi:MAG: hypothetical protein ABIR91_05430 [Candidatus Saccharimonadales bacterium]
MLLRRMLLVIPLCLFDSCNDYIGQGWISPPPKPPETKETKLLRRLRNTLAELRGGAAKITIIVNGDEIAMSVEGQGQTDPPPRTKRRPVDVPPFL